MENVSLKVNNCKYDKEQGKEIKNKLEFLLRQIPYDSRVFLDLQHKNKVFYGKLKVNFNGKSFFATDKDAILTSLIGSICKKVKKQVMKWKKSRTVEEITGVTDLNSYGQIKSSAGLLRSSKKVG